MGTIYNFGSTQIDYKNGFDASHAPSSLNIIVL